MFTEGSQKFISFDELGILSQPGGGEQEERRISWLVEPGGVGGAGGAGVDVMDQNLEDPLNLLAPQVL